MRGPEDDEDEAEDDYFDEDAPILEDVDDMPSLPPDDYHGIKEWSQGPRHLPYWFPSPYPRP